MADVYFTSDLHWGHRKVAELRGFQDPIDHDRALFSRWESTVQDDDQVWVLGDISVSSPTYALQLMSELPGHKHLIVGNHDKVHPMYRDAHKHVARYMAVFESVQAFARRKVLGHDVLLSHFPYVVDRDEPRFTQYRLKEEGLFLLHGHTHSDIRYTSDRELHVGVDAWDMTPVHLSEVEKFVQERLDAEAAAAEYAKTHGLAV